MIALVDLQRFRGGLVFKAHRLCVSLNSRLDRLIDFVYHSTLGLYHSTLGLRVIEKKKRLARDGPGESDAVS